ncbi:hypothetical protein GCM10017687_30790 [Streptomyces echinatus]
MAHPRHRLSPLTPRPVAVRAVDRVQRAHSRAEVLRSVGLRASGFGLRAPGSGLRAPGSGLRAPGSGYSDCSSAAADDPPTDEEWGVRRFFVRDPDGRVVNVLSHRRTPPSGRAPDHP